MLLLISLLSFLLPIQLGFHLNNFPSTVYGFRIDYLIPTIYLTDIITFLVVALGFRNIKVSKKHLVLGLLYLLFIVVNVYISIILSAAIYKWIKVSEMVLLGIVVVNTKKFDIFKNFIEPLSYSVFVACTLGVLQFVNKGSIGGIFYLLGERLFLFSDPNVSPYPYSTFSHPNSFAGFLLVFGLFLMQFKNKFNKKYFWTLSTLILANLVLTNSLNVYITSAFVIFLTIVKNKNVSLGIVFFDMSQRFIAHRIELIKGSVAMIKENFLIGVGLNNFIPNLVKVSNTFINSWELQPVHNIFLLVFSETGIIGLSAFLFLLFNFLNLFNLPLIAILITGMSDHYWLTLQQNILLFTFVLVISKLKQK